nr:putative late blight resistance protein homolog R1B-16 [Ipomoea batatas]
MGMRYLIVVDDIWSVEAWEELNRVFPECGNGSRIVLTSRQESVISDAKLIICLPFFTIDESWELLQVKLFKGKECPKELESIGKEISKKCGGLPLVVGLVVGLLGGVEKRPCPMEGPSVMEPIPNGSEILQTLELRTPLAITDTHLLRKLPGLKCLMCGVSKLYPFAKIEFLHHLESLTLITGDTGNSHLLNDLKLTKFPSNVKEIDFAWITLSSSAISIIAQLSKLEALTLSLCLFDEGLEWNVDEETQFCKLKYLKLFALNGTRIWNVSNAAESFPCLEQLILKSCFELQGLSYSFADISTLKLIVVVNCPRVNSSVKEIQEELQNIGSEQLTVHIEIDSVAEELRKSLMGWRYLIVLDDIWNENAWEELNRVLPSCDKGSRIVLTSREKSVVSDAKHICHLPFFTTDESWELLQVELFKGKGCPKEHENVGREISNKCKGLPLSVGLIADLLEKVEKSKQMWHAFPITLNSHVSFRDGIKTNGVIELCYKYLSSPLKSCLLYFAGIPRMKKLKFRN